MIPLMLCSSDVGGFPPGVKGSIAERPATQFQFHDLRHLWKLISLLAQWFVHKREWNLPKRRAFQAIRGLLNN